MDWVKKTVNLYRKKLLRLKNVVGVGIGIKEKNRRSTGKPAVVVLVKKKLPESRLRKYDIIPRTLNEIQTDVIEVGEIRLLDEETARTKKHRPAFPGLSIGHYKISAGTFGAVVKNKTTNELFIMSNNHVLANKTNGRDNRAKEGDPIFQPGPYDGGTRTDTIGMLKRFVPLIKTVEQSECPVAVGTAMFLNSLIAPLKPGYRIKLEKVMDRENTVDAAVAEPISPDAIEKVIFELGEVKGKRRAELGLDVVKSGRTSGITKAKIKTLSATLKVELGGEEYAYFANQIVTGPLAQPGDSGSLVLDHDNKAVGLLFAGSDETSVLNDIEAVEKALNVEVYF